MKNDAVNNQAYTKLLGLLPVGVRVIDLEIHNQWLVARLSSGNTLRVKNQ